MDNITEVARYVVDKANESEMKNVINAAHLWCRRKMTKDAIADDAMTQLHAYFEALDVYKEQEDSGKNGPALFLRTHFVILLNVVDLEIPNVGFVNVAQYFCSTRLRC